MADNHMFHKGGPGNFHLQHLSERAPLLLHGVGLSIAQPEKLDSEYLCELRRLVRWLKPQVLSDHLCFTRAHTFQTYDLLPFPYTTQFLKKIISRVHQVQDVLGQRFALENVSSYIEFKQSEMSELEFLSEVANATGCGILLDINNVYVSSQNMGWCPEKELLHLKPEQIVQYHVAGHSIENAFLYDTHDTPVCDAVWKLTAKVLAHFGTRPFVLEHDNEKTPVQNLFSEWNVGLRILHAERKSQHSELQPQNFTSEIVSHPQSEVGLESEFQFGVELQSQFVKYIQSPNTPNSGQTPWPLFLQSLEPGFEKALPVYRTCYFARVTSTLANTLFESASSLVSKEVLCGIVGRYLEQFPATQPNILDLARAVPIFAETLLDVSENAPWLPDFLQLCLIRWDTLVHTLDPPQEGTASNALLNSDSWEQLSLVPHVSMFASNHPIYDLWLMAEEGSVTTEGIGIEQTCVSAQQLPNGYNAVFVGKPEKNSLVMCRVPELLVPFATKLISGATLLESVSELESHSKNLQPEKGNLVSECSDLPLLLKDLVFWLTSHKFLVRAS
jgi:uncharacterized protein